MAIYIGVNGQAKKVKTAYIGDTYGNAQVIYKAGIVPSGYIPVQYIFNNHIEDNHISTGITANDYTRAILKFSGPTASYTSSSQYNILAASSYNIKYNDYRTDLHNIYVNVGSGSYSKGYSSRTIYIVDINRNASKETYVNDSKIFTNQSTGIGGTIQLLGSNTKQVYIYSLAIYQSILTGVLTKNYIPCIRISDERVGMWESVNGVFEIGSATSSSSYFSSGPVITE